MYVLRGIIIDNKEKEELAKKLYKEVLGYTDDEVEQIQRNCFIGTVAVNLSIEQAIAIVTPFLDNDIGLFLATEDLRAVAWQTDLGIYLEKGQPKEHYYDEPVVSREHLVDPYTRSKVDREILKNRRDCEYDEPKIKCPYCHSSNVTKISTSVGEAVLGLFGFIDFRKADKQWQCNRCNSYF